MNYESMSTDLIGVHWVNAWARRGVTTGCFGLPPRETMLKELRSMGTDDTAPPALTPRPWWQSWGVIGVVALTVGLLLWQPKMSKNGRRRRRLRRSVKRLRNWSSSLSPKRAASHYYMPRIAELKKRSRKTSRRLRRNNDTIKVFIRKEQEPYSSTGWAYRAFRLDDGEILPLYMGGETESEIKKRVKDHFAPRKVQFVTEPLKKNSVKKDIADLIRHAQSAGWTVDHTKNGHLRFKPLDPTKPIVIVGGTPSDHRALKNIKSMLRRSGLAVNARIRFVPCKDCKGTGDAPGTWPIEACPICDGEGKRPMSSIGMRRTRRG